MRRPSNRVNVRVLINEGGSVIDLVVDDNVEVLLGTMGGDVLVGEFLCFRHSEIWGSVKRDRSSGRIGVAEVVLEWPGDCARTKTSKSESRGS